MTDKAWATQLLAGTNLSTDRSTINDNFNAARLRTVTSITNSDSPYTANEDADLIEVDASSGAVTVYIGDTDNTQGQVYTVYKSDSSANAVTVEPSDGTDIEGSSSATLTSQYEAKTFVRLSSEWGEV